MTEGDLTGETGRSSASPRRRGRFRDHKVLAAALVLLLVPVLAVAGFVGYLNHLVTTNIQHQSLLPSIPVAAGPGATTTQAPAPVAREGTGQNYLLLGSDSPSPGGGRSDVIILVHVPADHGKVQLIHFPRDLYVSIPGHGKDKINAAYAYGGAPLLVQTLQDLITVHVDHVAVVGFDGFKRMTNAVGGVDVDVEESSSEGSQVFTKGRMHLNGDQALTFVRERHDLSQGDISRGRRQQAFLKALLLKGLSRDTLTNPVQLARFLDAATRNLVVDQGLSVDEMRSEALKLKDLRGDNIRFITAPLTGFVTTAAGASIDVLDEPKMAALGRAIAQDTVDAYVG